MMLMTFLTLTVLGLAALAQQGPIKSGTEVSRASKPIPAYVVYDEFFSHVLARDEAAVVHDNAGRNGNAMRTYYQGLLKFSDEEAATLKQTARDCKAAVDELGKKASKIIAASRAAYPDHKTGGDPWSHSLPSSGHLCSGGLCQKCHCHSYCASAASRPGQA